MKNNEIIIHLRKGRSSVTGSLYQYDYGQRLIINGAVLPKTYEVHFSNEPRGFSKTVLGDRTGVAIPDEYLISGDNIHVWIYLHDGNTDGETEYHGIITVIKRAKPTNQEPTPVQQDAITQAIAALNTAVTEAEGIRDAIPETVETALAEAKASGEFDGPQGEKGETGAQGPQGIQGEAGPKGDKGDPGDKGETGPKGEQGIQGPKGDQGIQGIKGDKGEQGERGPQGIQGEKGDKGDIGPQGEQGIQGLKGDKGDPGETGPQGPQGIQGPKGDTGERGLQGVPGETGATGAPGQDGVSPTISVTDITGGHRVTITDATGAHSFDVMDGDVADAPVQDVQVNGVSVLSDGVANVPQAVNNSSPGVVIPASNDGVGITTATGKLFIANASTAQVKAGTNQYRPITPSNQHESAFYALAKLAGADMASSSNPVGTYTDAAKVAIQKMLGIYEAPWELIRSDLVTNETKEDIEITVDSNGQQFELTDIRLMVSLPQQETEAKVEEYGRVRCYYSNDQHDLLYIGALTIAAGENGRGVQCWIEQHNGMIERNYTVFNSSGTNVPVLANNAFSTASFSHWEIGTKTYYKIKICAVTGQCKYYLYGKRKWN